MRTVNGVAVLNTAEELPDPDRIAVLVLDMQNETASSRGGYARNGYDISGVRSVVPSIHRMLAACRRLGLLIGFTEFVHRNRQGISLMDGPSTFLHRGDEWVSDVVDGSWEAQTIGVLASQRSESRHLPSNVPGGTI
jgi:ureidoacrylate peracid hydrolase